MITEIEKIIIDLEQDVHYFENMGFKVIASKFSRDLALFQKIIEDKTNNMNKEEIK